MAKKNHPRTNRIFSGGILARMACAVCLVILSVGMVCAQDLHFSQFYEAPLLRNPALAGLFTGDIRAQVVYRNQWNSISFPYQTGALSGEIKFPVGHGDDYMTAGLQIFYDKAGSVALTTTHLLPAINYHKSLSGDRNSYLSLGFMGGLVSRRLDRSKITTNSQYDGFSYNGALPDGEVFGANYSFLDAAIGMSYNSTLGAAEEHNYFIGVAYHHLNKPNDGFYEDILHLPKWVVSGGLKLNLNEFSYLTFHTDYTTQGPYSELIGGGLYSRKVGDEDVPTYTVSLGAYFRWQDAFIPVVKLDYDPFSLGFSYDINVSDLKTASQGRGGFELSLSYIGFMKHEDPSLRLVHCPKF